MIYLNEGFEGGGTNFPKLNRVIEPGQGKALWWHNMENGKVQEQYLHEGMPIIKGKKYIVTSWWREKRWDGAGDETQYEESKSRIVKVEPPLMNASESNIKIYKNKDDVPKVTPKGFDLMKCPEETWNIIKDSYKLLLTHKTEESFEGKKEFIEGQTELLSFDLIPSIRDLIHTQLIEVHKNFSNNNLNPSAVYGIRSYNRGAVLKPHYDRVETHHISSIVIVDKDLACGCSNKPEADDWALDIQGHDGEWYKIYAEPGDMILYESAVCQHGRKEPFGGTFFRNFYVHYQYDH
jgi:prolyl 4-hydroxylase